MKDSDLKKNLLGVGRSRQPADIPAQLEDEELQALGTDAVRDGCGVSVKHASSGLLVEDSSGDFHGISYGAFRSKITLGGDQQHLAVVFEQFDGEYELHVAGTELKSLARQMTTQQRVTLHVGGQVTGIEVVKREEAKG